MEIRSRADKLVGAASGRPARREIRLLCLPIAWSALVRRTHKARDASGGATTVEMGADIEPAIRSTRIARAQTVVGMVRWEFSVSIARGASKSPRPVAAATSRGAAVDVSGGVSCGYPSRRGSPTGSHALVGEELLSSYGGRNYPKCQTLRTGVNALARVHGATTSDGGQLERCMGRERKRAIFAALRPLVAKVPRAAKSSSLQPSRRCRGLGFCASSANSIMRQNVVGGGRLSASEVSTRPDTGR